MSDIDPYEDPDNETCSWCGALVPDVSLVEQEDGARICPVCVEKAKELPNG